jgi:hypothetical protein
MARKVKWFRRKKDVPIVDDGTASPHSSKETTKAGAGGEASEPVPSSGIESAFPESAVEIPPPPSKKKKNKGFNTFEVVKHVLIAPEDIDPDDDATCFSRVTLKSLLPVVKVQQPQRKPEKTSPWSQTPSCPTLDILNAPMDMFNQLMSCTSTRACPPVKEEDLLNTLVRSNAGDARADVSHRVYSWPLTKPDAHSVLASAKDEQARQLAVEAEAKCVTQVNDERKKVWALIARRDKLKAKVAGLKAKICDLDQVNALAAYKGMQVTEKMEELRIAHTEEVHKMEEKLRTASELVSQLKLENSRLSIDSVKALQKANDESLQEVELAKQEIMTLQKAYDEIRVELEQTRQANNTDTSRAPLQEEPTKTDSPKESFEIKEQSKTDDAEKQEQAVVTTVSLEMISNDGECNQEFVICSSLGRVGDSNAGNIDIHDQVVAVTQNNKEELVSNRVGNSSSADDIVINSEVVAMNQNNNKRTGSGRSVKSFGSRKVGGWFRKFVGMGGGHATDDGSQNLNSFEIRTQSQSTCEMSVPNGRTQEEFDDDAIDDDAIDDDAIDDDASYTDESDSDAEVSDDSNEFGSSETSFSSYDSRVEVNSLAPSDSISSKSSAKDASYISNKSSTSKSPSSTFESDIDVSGMKKDTNGVISWFNASDWPKSLIPRLQQEGRDENEVKRGASEQSDRRILTLAE